MSDNYVRVAKIDELPEGTARVFTVDEIPVAVCNVEGNIYAIGDVCTHDGGPLGEGELVDSQIECPRHGARFDVKTGKALCLPAVLPVPTYKVEVRGDEVWIGVPVGASGTR